ncbi:hypothetical protein EVAR_58774_1, partial [Eumeta japonica]
MCSTAGGGCGGGSGSAQCRCGTANTRYRGSKSRRTVNACAEIGAAAAAGAVQGARACRPSTAASCSHEPVPPRCLNPHRHPRPPHDAATRHTPSNTISKLPTTSPPTTDVNLSRIENNSRRATPPARDNERKLKLASINIGMLKSVQVQNTAVPQSWTIAFRFIKISDYIQNTVVTYGLRHFNIDCGLLISFKIERVELSATLYYP